MDALLPLQFWHWLALALVFLIAEMVAPGFFCLWLALAAGITGAVAFVVPTIDITYQVLLFGISAAVLLWVGQRYVPLYRVKTDEPTLNSRAQSLIGVDFPAPHDLRADVHPLMIQGTLWHVKTPACTGGTRLKIVGVEGSMVLVAAPM